MKKNNIENKRLYFSISRKTTERVLSLLKEIKKAEEVFKKEQREDSDFQADSLQSISYQADIDINSFLEEVFDLENIFQAMLVNNRNEE